ncbi:SGNH/GDSL hydrolase family protein [Nonomuraea sp. NPDC003709]|uniref:SGNH/GDSL hydrolase family protein n=1 Tax=Nonomuraea sp. NPDC003709 TaxID=3154450 RepID=UPI0033B17C76
MLRFQHPEKVLGYLGPLSADRLGPLFGLSSDEYEQIRGQYAEQARQIAADLLADQEVAEAVDRLPFAPGAHVAAVGESTTADLLSWFEILRHLLGLRRPHDRITLVNLAVTGQTTTQALAGLPALTAQPPDWVLCMLGGNDATRFGGSDTTRVSLGETERNLRLLRGACAAGWAWIAPTPVDEARIAAYQPFQRAGLRWANDDVAAIASILADMPEPTVALTTPAHEDDGLHLSAAGQRALAEVVVKALAEETS